MRDVIRRDSSECRFKDCFSAVTLVLGEYCEQIKRVARFCMASNFWVRYACEGCKIDVAYSSSGRTNVGLASF